MCAVRSIRAPEHVGDVLFLFSIVDSSFPFAVLALLQAPAIPAGPFWIENHQAQYLLAV
jgi:hypothetical protein